MRTVGLIVLKDEPAIGIWRWRSLFFRICLTNGTIRHLTVFHCTSIPLILSNWPLRQ